MTSPVPVRNVYYLLCYAWDHARELPLVDAGLLEGLELLDLLAYALARGAQEISRRGLDRAYDSTSDEVTAVRGRIELAAAVKQGRLVAPTRLPCHFDELHSDVLHNRIIATMLRRCLFERLPKDVRGELEVAEARFHTVATVPLAKSLFRQVQLHRNNAFYGFLMNVCELLFELSMPDAEGGGRSFRDFRDDDGEMSLLFEAFVRNFYRHHLDDVRVSRDTLTWRFEALSADAHKWLPEMHTDITLRTGTRTLIVETKFYREPLNRRFGSRKLHRDHLSQLLSYLTHADHEDGPDARADGMLLYARVDDDISADFRLGPHQVRVRTVDLRASWQDIRNQLLAFAEDLRAA